MRIIRNSILPPKSHKLLTLWPYIFVRKETRVYEPDVRHETIHGEQQKEMLIVLFLLWYGLEWLIRLAVYLNMHKAYRMVSFEQEAYLNEQDRNYVDSRKRYAWIKYIV